MPVKELTYEQKLIGLIKSNPLRVIKENNNRSFFEFLKYFWPQVSSEELVLNWHIEYLCNKLQVLAERVVNNLPKKDEPIINIPPGSTKTIICSIMLPAWCWTRWYWMRFITGSYSSALSLESAEYSRELIRSDEFKLIYPELGIKEDKDQKSNFRVIYKEYKEIGRVPRIKIGGNRYSTSVGASVTGFHAHIIIIDDPLDPRRAASKVELDKANKWMGRTLSMRKVNKVVTPTILVMQRLHQDDPTGNILKKKKKSIQHICIPGVLNDDADKARVQPPELLKYYKGGLFDVIRMNRDVLTDALIDLGQYGFASQISQNPVPPTGGMFKVDRFSIITSMPPIGSIVRTIRYWDKAGTADGGAYTVGLKMHILKSGIFLISDIVRGQWESHIREQKIKDTAIADGTNISIYFEQEPGSGGKESAQATIRNLVGFASYADLPRGDKVYRADPFSVQVNNGNVQVLTADWNNEFFEEFRFFPFSKYKDQVDAASGAFSKLVGKKKVRRIT